MFSLYMAFLLLIEFFVRKTVKNYHRTESIRLSNKKFIVSKSFYIAFVAVLALWGLVSIGFAQNESNINKITDIRLVAHPSFTRLIFDLNKNVPYKIYPDFKKGIVSIIFENSMSSMKVKKKNIFNRHIKNLKVLEPTKGVVRLDIKLIYASNIFFHIPLKDPSRLVFDVKNKPPISLEGEELKFSQLNKTNRFLPVEEKNLTLGSRKIELQEITEKEAEKEKEWALVENNQKKLEKESDILLSKRREDGRENYFMALRIFQSKDYLMAKREFNAFLGNYPKSKYKADAMFLKAESEYKIMLKNNQHIDLQEIIDSFNHSLAQFPHSKNRDMSLYKIAELYKKMGLTLESKAYFKILIDEYPGGRYTQKARIRRAQILVDEKDYGLAYKDLQEATKQSSTGREAREAVFKIAYLYYENRKYSKAIKIYEDADLKWPIYIQNHPEIIHRMGEAYIKLRKMNQAQSKLFLLVNLYPEHELTPKSLNRIGEIYRMAEKDKSSAKVFHEAIIRKPESEEAPYGLIRIADLGVLNPSMKFHNMIFNYESYYDPLKTYKAVFEKYPQSPLAQLALMREGIALAKNKNYIGAINKYRQILSADPDIAIKENLIGLILDSFFALVDVYYKQKGYLPLLKVYYQNVRPYQAKIKNPKVLLRIGESYQAIGLDDLALEIYQKVKGYDKKGAYSESIGFKIAQINFTRKKYEKAEEIIRKFMAHFKNSRKIKKAMQILAHSLYAQGKYDQAVHAYTKLIKRFPKAQETSESYYYLAHSYYKQKKYKEAVKRYQESIRSYVPENGMKKKPDYIADSYFKIADCFYKIREYSASIKTYQKAIKKNPGDQTVSYARYIMAKSYNIINQGDNALKKLKYVEKESEMGVFNRAVRLEASLVNFSKIYKNAMK